MEVFRLGKKLVLKTDIERKEGCLYYCKGSPLEVWEVPMSRSGKKKGR